MKARENPLNTDKLESLKYQFLEGSWTDLSSNLKALNYRAAIVGPQGSGKTTLLLELKQQLELEGNSVHLYGLRRESKKIPSTFWLKGFSKNCFVLLDGAEQLNFLEWPLLKLKTASLKGLIVTSHNPGLLPTLIQCSTSEDLFLDLLSKLVGNAVSKEEATKAYRKSGGNIRLAFLSLYDVLSKKQITF